MAGASSQYETKFVTLIEPLVDISVRVNQSVSLECKVINSEYEQWYKDGVIITAHEKNKQKISNGSNYKLLIKSASYSDTGVYTIICSDYFRNVECKAIVTVIPKLEKGFYIKVHIPRELGVITPLKSVTAPRGKQVVLNVQFKSDFIKNIYWYKNNEIIETNENVEIHNNKSSSQLVIIKCDINDSGVYTVVINSDYILDSNYCDVRVIDQLHVIEEVKVPGFIEKAPAELTVNLNEEVRIIYKISRNEATEVFWSRNNIAVDFTDGVHIEENCGPDYIGMRILKPIIADWNNYTVCLRNNLTTVNAACSLVISEHPPISLPIGYVSKPLETAVASIGQQILYDCVFSFEYNEYYFVQWRLGRHTIKRSDDKFNVAYQNGRCLLHANKIQYGMEGPVVCELRLHVPYQKSILICKSTGYLIIIPPNAIKYFMDKMKIPNCYKVFKRYNDYVIEDNQALKHVLPSHITDECLQLSKERIPMADDDVEKVAGPSTSEKLVIEIMYCRLDRKQYYINYLRTLNYKGVRLAIKNRSNVMGDDRHDGFEFVWYSDGLKDKKNKFKIELHHEKLSKVIGTTNWPKLKIINTKINEMIRICIYAVLPNSKLPPCDILIDMRKIDEDYWNTFYKTHEKRPIYTDPQKFESFYTETEINLGSGSCGNVFLVEGTMTSENKNKLFAGKIVKTGTRRKNLKARHEYNMLLDLEHKNIVFMHCMLQTQNHTMVILDFLWGGDLFDAMNSRNQIDEGNLVVYIKQICAALCYLHDHNVAHLDVKPENIILEHPNSRRLKVIDFGISRRYSGRHGWVSKTIVGTKIYLAPEMISCTLVSGAADMWSLGILLYILLTGEIPFPNGTWINHLKQAPIYQEPQHNFSLSSVKSLSTSSDSSACSIPSDVFKFDLSSSSQSDLSNAAVLPGSSVPYKIPSFQTSSSLSSSNALIKKSSSDEWELWFVNYFYNNASLEHVSLAGKDFLSQLLTIDSTKRMKSINALKHPWLKHGPTKIQSVSMRRSKSESSRFKRPYNNTLKKVATTSTMTLPQKSAQPMGKLTEKKLTATREPRPDNSESHDRDSSTLI